MAAIPRRVLLGLRQVGGARLADELVVRVRPVLGTQLQQVFGMAEGLLNYTRPDDPDDVVCTTQGGPLSPADEVRLVDELDRDVRARFGEGSQSREDDVDRCHAVGVHPDASRRPDAPGIECP